MLTLAKNLSREAWTEGVKSAGRWRARVTSRQWLRSCGERGCQGPRWGSAAVLHLWNPTALSALLAQISPGPARELTLKLTGSTRSLWACRSLSSDKASGRLSMWPTALVSASATFLPCPLIWAEPCPRSKWEK